MFIFPSMYEFIVVIDVFLSVLQDATGRSLVSCILKAYAAVWFFHLGYKLSWSVSYKRYDSGDLRRLAHLKAKERLCLQQF